MRNDSLSIVGLVFLLLASATSLEGQHAAADSAWRAGDHARAELLYGTVLASDSTDRQALHRLALIHGWTDRHQESIALFDRLLALAPENRGAAIERARVLAWSGEHAAAIDAVEAILEREPGDRDALAAHAQFTAWAGRFPASLRSYEALLAVSPDDPEARRGLARVTSWSGRLRQGEHLWQELVAADPADVEALLGLAAVQRWRGRTLEARATLDRAAALAPDNPEVRAQILHARAAFAPRVSPTVVYESDSDGNRMVTSAVAVSYSPTPRLQLRVDAYSRDLGYGPAPDLAGRAHGATIGLSALLPARWVLSAAAGASGRTSGESTLIPTFHASVASPRDHRFGAAASVSHAALDATAQLARNRVEVSEATLSGRFQGDAGTTGSVRVSRATFAGSERNVRHGGSAELFQRVTRPLSLGVTVTAFGFEHDLQDGYFDPDFFGVALLGARWSREAGKWNFNAEAAPGIQRVGSGGDVRGVAQLSGRLGYLLAPGRELSISGGYSSSGLTEFSTQGADYRYRSLGVAAGWTF
jgi:tetratricopeptide (TPR) repeat protein